MAGGFRPVNNFSASDFNGKIKTFHVASGHSTLLAVGDVVRISGTSFTDGTEEVDAGAAAQTLTGVIVGFSPNFSSLESKGLAASTAGFVFVNIDPDAEYLCETSGGTIAVTDVGLNADMVATAATSSGNLVNSNMTLNAASFGSATAQWRVLSLTQDSNGDLGTAAGSTVRVKLNESTVTGVVGV